MTIKILKRQYIFPVINIILCLILSILFFISKIQPKARFFIEHPELKPTKSLEKNFTIGLNNCAKKERYTAFEVEVCAWEYVKNQSMDDYRILEKIRHYCLDTTGCEADRRECIEKIIN